MERRNEGEGEGKKTEGRRMKKVREGGKERGSFLPPLLPPLPRIFMLESTSFLLPFFHASILPFFHFSILIFFLDVWVAMNKRYAFGLQ